MDNRTLQYWGEFRSKGGTLWRVEIWRNGIHAVRQKPLTFPYDTPLEIEWSSTDKIKPVQTSSATLTLVSEGDRDFLDLYSIEVGSVALMVFRNPTPQEYGYLAADHSSLYWCGTLDTELYEEPFSEKNDYEVTLTFSDFAILNRLNYQEKNRLWQVERIIQNCLQKAQALPLNPNATKEKYCERCISTKRGENVAMFADYILEDNFYDEKGKPCTYMEVLEGVLQPYALRVIQKEGKYIVYDLNALYEGDALTPPVKDVVWAGTDASLSVDKVYNNVKLTFSPYEITELAKPEIKMDPYASILTKKVDVAQGGTVGFEFYWGEEGGSGIEKGEQSKYFTIIPLADGDDSTGILWSYFTGTNSSIDLNWKPSVENKYYTGYSSINNGKLPVVMRTKSVYLPRYEKDNPIDKVLQITLPLLFDARYNPYVEASEDNQQGNYDIIQHQCNYAYIPAELELIHEDGRVTHHYDNSTYYSAGKFKNGRCGEWKENAPAKEGRFLLSYYNSTKEHVDNSGLGGWQENRQTCYPSGFPLPGSFMKRLKGESVAIPPGTGFLRLTIYAGIYLYKAATRWNSHSNEEQEASYQLNFETPIHRWWAYKAPKIELCNTSRKDIETADIEMSAFLNEAAKDELEINTIVGTQRRDSSGRPSTLFTGLGLLRNQQSRPLPYQQKDEYVRAGKRNWHLEHLLMNTIYSQYAKRHLILSGTVELLPEFGLFSDRNEKGKYLLTSEVQNLSEDESKISMVQVSPETYVGVEYVNE